MKILFPIILFLFPSVLFAQHLPLSHDLEVEYQLQPDHQLPLSATAVHPWIVQVPDSVKRTKGSWIGRKLFREHFIGLDSMGVKFTVDPLVNFTGGYESVEGKKTWTNTRGFIIKGMLGEQFAFETTFTENQGVFPSYLDKFIRKNSIVPGSGFVKSNGNGVYDYAMASGYLSYTPSKYFNFQLGTGKHFIGEGYRSMLLSDQSFNYPFLRITTSFWHIKYTNLYAQLQDLTHYTDGAEYWRKKYTTMHVLSWDVTKNFNIGFFEAVVWNSKDSLAHRGFEINYLNPVIFLRPVEFSLGSPDNMLLGFLMNYRLNRTTIYGQVMLDEFKLDEVVSGKGWWANKQGFQLGVKTLEPFGIKGLYLLTELNQARPYTYAHWNRMTSYGHYNQPLAHPLGANFREWVGIARYQKGKWIGEAKVITALYGLDMNNLSYGMNVFESYNTKAQEYNNRIGQGLRTHLFYTDLQCRYIINPAIHLEAVAGMKYRNETNSVFKQKDNEFYLGIRTSLLNLYGEF